MRGINVENEPFFSYVNMNSRVPENHPLRPIQGFVRQILKKMTRQFDKLYSHTGRPSIPPEQLLKAMLIQMLFSVRSERQLMEQLNYNLLFRWFVGLSIDTPVWDPTVFTKNRDRLLDGDIAGNAAVHHLDGIRRRLRRTISFCRGHTWGNDRPCATPFPRLRQFRRRIRPSA